MIPTRPLLRYHGGKWRIALRLIANFPKHRIYVEPFCGAASVLLRKPRAYAEVINDLNDDVVNLFRVLRSDKESLRLIAELQLTPFARQEFEQSYEPTEDCVENARRLIIRSFMGFGSFPANGSNTGFRSNNNRSGTTPSHDWMNYPKCLHLIIERLQGIVIEHRDAVICMKQHDSKHTLFYVDPPYVHETRTKAMQQAYTHEMLNDDHEQLAECLHNLQGMVVLSGYRCPLYDDLYRTWERIDFSAFADGARKRIESLWLNPAATLERCQTTLIFNKDIKLQPQA
jgi:DNA adenine methylase